MASQQSRAVSRLYHGWLTMPSDWTSEETKAAYDAWSSLTSEPGSVDYIEIDTGARSPSLWVNPKGADEDRVILAIHGGGFVSGSVYTHRKVYAHLAKAIGARALLVEYPLMPEVYPTQLIETLTSYRWLLDQGIEARHVAFTGDSAGGTLAIGTQLRARDEGLPLPAATMLLSPWTDMLVSGGTAESNAGNDALFNKQWVQQMASAWLDGADPRNPQASAIYADLSGFGPINIQVGDQELLLDDSRRLAANAEKAGVEVVLDIFPGQQHTFQMMAGFAPEADEAIRRLAEWVGPKLGIRDALVASG